MTDFKSVHDGRCEVITLLSFDISHCERGKENKYEKQL